MKLDPMIISAYDDAKRAQENAYAPYSKFKVGAAVKLAGVDKWQTGANVENQSYPAGICAERNALFASIARFGRRNIEWMVIVADIEQAILPCGVCLQAISEFAGDDFPFYLANRREILKKVRFRELLPYCFSMLET